MSSEAEFPRSPLRDYDPFGQKTGENPFGEPPVANAPDAGKDDDNIYAASASLADPAPPVEYETVLEPRILVISSTAAIGLCVTVIATLLLIAFPPSAGELSGHAVLFPIALAFFVGVVMLTGFDLKAMRVGAMKRDSIEMVRRLSWISWLGIIYSFGIEIFCIWPLLEDVFHLAFG
jgi:hypothetical protein